MTRSAPSARRVAFDALCRIEDGAYANLVLPALLERSGLPRRDRALATELAYGTTRMRRACDFLIDPYLLSELDPPTRALLRLGTYQLAYLRIPPHAAVAETVRVAPRKVRGLVNAVLRRVAASLEAADPSWPDDATRLSYPDWVVARLSADIGSTDALAALEQMSEAASVTERADGYVQDAASQWVTDLVEAGERDRVADLCAAPGGKATALARMAAFVVAGDVAAARARLVVANAARFAVERLAVVVADGRQPPLRPGFFDRVLVDAPCSGLGVLRRRPDARWRIEQDDVTRLAELQRALLAGAAAVVSPGGLLVYSVCTMTRSETLDIDAWLGATFPDLVPLEPPGPPWRPWGRGALVCPHDAGTDGMFVLRLRRDGG